ncbi:conserved phage C-terminal domain-containing protein [Bibersteinia trehalosi]|uniref:conserved phage C-terminal domain-containing protein n=1 Tax=Bibersteinia trehalosi TaxID=47735 RepID=UPI002D767400|nr:conserved phage C-terminal domain-containing protein [Bibersteinia trehalosi]
MRYSIHINQVRCVEWGIKPSLGGIVDLINQASSWATATVINGFTYYWIEPAKVAEELISEGWKRDTARRHMNTLRDEGIIDLVMMDGKYYVRLTEKGATWNQIIPIRQTEKNSSGENSSELPRKKIRETAKKNSPDKYIQELNTTSDQSPLTPTGEPAPAETVLDYLNTAVANLAAELGEHKPLGFKLKPWAKNISARIAESSVAECQQVVDYLVAKWGRDGKMREYICPKTIFRQSNFADYLPKSHAWASNGKPVCVNGKWVKQADAAKCLITPTVDEVKAWYQKALNYHKFSNAFKSLDFSDKRNLVLYHAAVKTKNRNPLEREFLAVISQAIKDTVEHVDTLRVPSFE